MKEMDCDQKKDLLKWRSLTSFYASSVNEIKYIFLNTFLRDSCLKIKSYVKY